MQVTPPSKSAQAANSSVSAAATASELLGRLPAEHKYALGGLIANRLGKRADIFGDAFCRQHLRRVAASMLQLAPDQCEGLVPLFDGAASIEPDAFIGLLPESEEERAAILLGLV